MKTKTSNKYVIFCLGDTQFGIAVMKSKEIFEYGKITRVPEAPEYIEGVINVRGSVVPVVDLSRKLFNKNHEIIETTSIIISEPEIDGEKLLMGLIVDNVKDVLEIKDEKLEPPPKYGSKLKSEYILNVTSLENDFIFILDIDRVLSQINIDEDLGKLLKNKSAQNENKTD